MMRIYIFVLICLHPLYTFSQSDPVLLRINGQEITRSEFEFYYHAAKERNLSGIFSPEEYIEILVNNKLKIAEAEEAGLDTSNAFLSEIENYRRQLSREYLTSGTMYEREYRTLNTTSGNEIIEGYHIYKYLPQNTPVFQVNMVNQQMDSLYYEITRNPALDFYQLVEKFSDDRNLFKVSRLDVPEEFENSVFSLNTGEVSKPFSTPQGIHIVKVVRKSNTTSPEYAEYFTRKQKRQKRVSKSADLNVDKIKQEHNFIPNNSAINELTTTGKTQDVLFTIDGQPYTMAQFERFSQDNPRGIKSQVDEFIVKSLYDYENSRLEWKHPEIATRVKWHRDIILLNAINSHHTGENINESDLKSYFEDHKKDYYWELPRFRGIVVHCENKRTGKKIKKQLRKIPESQWVDYLNRNYNSSSQNKVLIEEGTFAVGQNDYVDKLEFKVGKYIPVPSHPFTIIAGKRIKGPESYEEIPDIVVNDYRTSQETRWIKRLRSKSKVEINQEVLKTVNNQ